MVEKEKRTTRNWLALWTAGLVCAMALAMSFVLRDMRAVQLIDKLLDSWQGFDVEKNLFLQGNFRPVADEYRAFPLKVISGALPQNLSGVFVRNGPNPIPNHVSKGHHWFDGHGMMHNVRIRNGKALYSNSYITTPRYKIEQELDQEFFLKIGEMNGFIGLLKVLLLGAPKLALTGVTKLTVGQANTHSIMYQNKFYALHEASLPFEVELTDDGSIKGVGYETFDNVLNYPVSAHAKVDFLNGNLLFHGYAADPEFVKRDGSMKVGERYADTGQLELYFGVKTQDGQVSFAHDMMFTKNWIVLFDCSVTFNVAEMINKGSPFRWSGERNMRIGLVPRTREFQKAWATDVMWVDVGSPHVTVHALNAWEEEDGTVVIWLPLGDRFSMNLGRSENSFYMAEIRLDPRTGTVAMTKINDEYNLEFPRVRDSYLGRFARYAYTAFIVPENRLEGSFNGFIVWDMERRAVHKVVRYPAAETGGEPVIIPKPDTSSSNEVYIGTFLCNDMDGTSSFVLYDGETASEEPVAKLRIPYRVPYGFHGRWVDETELQHHIQYHASRRSSEESVA
jgi:carotenoid cleavage dioxygenase